MAQATAAMVQAAASPSRAFGYAEQAGRGLAAPHRHHREDRVVRPALHLQSGTVRPHRDLCEAARLAEWHHEDDVCWVADCEVCGVPMVVWKQHGAVPPDAEVEHMLAQLTRVSDARFGTGEWSVDRVMRQIPTTSTPMAETQIGGSAASAELSGATRPPSSRRPDIPRNWAPVGCPARARPQSAPDAAARPRYDPGGGRHGHHGRGRLRRAQLVRPAAPARLREGGAEPALPVVGPGGAARRAVGAQHHLHRVRGRPADGEGRNSTPTSRCWPGPRPGRCSHSASRRRSSGRPATSSGTAACTSSACWAPWSAPSSPRSRPTSACSSSPGASTACRAPRPGRRRWPSSSSCSRPRTA